jgi:seryl-tRNA synthetase
MPRVATSSGIITISRFAMSSASTSHRPSAVNLSLDVVNIANHLNVAVAHLRARRSDEALIAEVESIPDLRKRRNSLIVDGDGARARRKALSKEIGKLIHQGKQDEVARIKEQVEECNTITAQVDIEKDKLDEQIQDIISRIPNFLDDR